MHQIFSAPTEDIATLGLHVSNLYTVGYSGTKKTSHSVHCGFNEQDEQPHAKRLHELDPTRDILLPTATKYLAWIRHNPRQPVQCLT